MRGTASNYVGYTIRISDYKDSDCIVTFLTEENVLTFRARGIKKIKSKNRNAISPLTKSEVTLLQMGESLTLSEAKQISAPKLNGDFLLNSCFSFLNELNSKIVDSDETSELYEWLDEAMNFLNQKNDEYLTPCLIYFAQFLRLEGYGLDVDDCVVCGKKNDIVGISLSKGGFLCREHLEFEFEKKEPRFLKIIRFCFRCSPKDMNRVHFEKKECLRCIAYLSEFYEQSAGEKLRSLEYLRLAS
ncbi:MAG TPA: DNA repair protein RecO [Firmicutes bacterium]|nr:DNA repair protein RecO [Bacillota bacterium]HBN00670.1 DNA repair protein RecO [Bacillota bacterium]